jgi:hypothetical protein
VRLYACSKCLVVGNISPEEASGMVDLALAKVRLQTLGFCQLPWLRAFLEGLVVGNRRSLWQTWTRRLPR